MRLMSGLRLLPVNIRKALHPGSRVKPACTLVQWIEVL